MLDCGDIVRLSFFSGREGIAAWDCVFDIIFYSIVFSQACVMSLF